MTPKALLDEIMRLPVSERLQLVEDLWDSLEGQIPVPDWHRQELDHRLESFRRDPASGASWEDVRERIQKRGA